MYINEKLHDLIQPKQVSNYQISYKHHIVFWLIYFIFNTLRWGSYHGDYDYSLKTNLIGFPIHMALSYFNIYYLMPKYVFRRKYAMYTLLLIGSLFFMLFAKYYLTYYLVSTDVWPEGPTDHISGITIDYAIQTMLGELYVISFVTAIKITIDWLQEHSKLHELERRQMTTELRFLRSQVSPHFFFNTLNNIYSLTLEKSNQAPEVVLKLSELMRYLLYATKKRKQSLKKEIECIQNYIDLERIRFDDNLKVNVSITGDLEDKEIAPMLLIPLVENSFKHGASKNIGKMNICISAKVVDGFLYFEVSNTKPQEGKKDKIASRPGGIGLSNVRKRLQLGYAPDEYQFKVDEDKTNFTVSLKLKV